MSKQAADFTVKATRKAVRNYLDSNDNGRGEAYFKANDLADNHESMNPRQVGRGLAAIENDGMDGVGIERWGVQRSTRWRAFYTE